MRSHVMEGVGTFFLALAIFSGNVLAIGLTLMAMIYIGGHISGGHYNPAVTLAAWTFKGRDFADTLTHMLAQLVGGVVAAAAFTQYANQMPTIQSSASTQHVLGLEALGAFALALLVLTVTNNAALRGNAVNGLVIGLTLTALVTITAPISGGILNPAVSAGALIFNALSTGGDIARNTLFLYVAGPLLGGVVAAYAYRFLNE